MISLQNLGKSYGERTLFAGVTLQLVPGSRYGLVGANGSGKTTLLQLLAGDEPATEGTAVMAKRTRLGVLRQDRFLADEELILDLAMMGDGPVWDALVEQRRLIDGHGDDAVRIADLEEQIRVNDGYTLEARASAVLEGLGIPGEAHRRPLATLSGGFKLRVLLAQVLIGGPDVLLLDEPTNHLDILSIRWLERFLADYTGCAVVISHDQRFLDNVATHILDVDYETITLYTGNYAAFTIEKRAIRERKEGEIARAEEAIAHKRAYVERFGFKASKAKQAQSRLKQIARIEVEELVQTSRRAPTFRFVQERPSGRDVLAVTGLSKSYGPKRVLEGLSLVVHRGEKVAVIGPNGLGKSTLLRLVMGRIEADAGTIRWGHEARPGYFAQDHRELLDDDSSTPLRFLSDACPRELPAAIRGQLGLALFSGDDVHKRVGSLSGGEAARLVFSRLMLERPNVLVLDEPTNHLDLEAIHALAEALARFEGTILFVSHDRWFVSQLATRVVELSAEGPRDFAGTYDEYLARCGDDHLDADAVVLRAKKEKKLEAAAAPAAGASWEEQKRRRNRQKDLVARRDRATKALEVAEARAKVIHDLYQAPGFFERTDRAEIDALAAEEAALGPRIEALMAEWESTERELAELGA